MTLLPNGVITLPDPNWVWQDRPGKRGKRLKPLPQDLNQAIDRSVKEGGLWEKGTFTVPRETTEERVGQVAHKYVKRFAQALELEGYTVLRIVGPIVDLRMRPVEPDRRRYIMFGWVKRRPVVPIYDIPDEQVPAMLKAGLRLVE